MLKGAEFKDKMARLENCKQFSLVDVDGDSGGRVRQRDSGRSVQIDFHAGSLGTRAVDKEAV